MASAEPVPAATDAPVDTRTRLLEASLACVERSGLRDTSLDDVARQAGMSRATVYRYFPGGREQLVSDTVTFEVGNFLRRLGEAVAGEPDLAGRLRTGLVFGHRAVVDHGLLQQVLHTERDVFLRELADAGPLMLATVRAYLREQLDGERLEPGVSADEAAEHLARLFLSYLGSHGRWDMTDPAAVNRLVRTYLLAGIVDDPGARRP